MKFADSFEIINCFVKSLILCIGFLLILQGCKPHKPLSAKDLDFNDQEMLMRARNSIATEFWIVPYIEASNHPADTIAIYWYDKNGNCTRMLSKEGNAVNEFNNEYTNDSLHWLAKTIVNNKAGLEYNYRYNFNSKTNRLLVYVAGFVSDTNYFQFNNEGKLIEAEFSKYGINGKGRKYHQKSEYENNRLSQNNWIILKCDPFSLATDSDRCVMELNAQFEERYLYTNNNLDSTITLVTFKNDKNGYNQSFRHFMNGLVTDSRWVTGKRYEHKYSKVPFKGGLTSKQEPPHLPLSNCR